MRQFGRIETAIWQNPKFRSLSDDGRVLWLYTLCCPHGNAVGCFVLPDGYIMADLGWSPERVSETVSELFGNGLIDRDETTALTLVRGWWGHNTIENGNVAKGAVKAIQALPRCSVFFRFINAIERFPKPLQTALRNAFPNGLPNGSETKEPEPEPEREPEKENTKQQVATPAAREPDRPEPSSLPEGDRSGDNLGSTEGVGETDAPPPDPVLAEAKAILAAHAEAVTETYAMPGWQPHREDITLAKSLVRGGFTAAEIGPVIRGKLVVLRDKAEPAPRSLAYFEGAIRDTRKPKAGGKGQPEAPRQGGFLTNEERAERLRHKTVPEREERLAAMSDTDRAEVEAFLAKWDAEQDIPGFLQKAG